MAYYNLNTQKVRNNIVSLTNAFKIKGLDFRLFYSVKTNYIDAVLKEVFNSGNGFEIVSRNEWLKVEKYSPKDIVLNGPNKNIALVNQILKSGCRIYFNIDNDTDIEILKKCTKSDLQKISVGIRVY